MNSTLRRGLTATKSPLTSLSPGATIAPSRAQVKRLPKCRLIDYGPVATHDEPRLLTVIDIGSDT
jgi:hypothetical protein